MHSGWTTWIWEVPMNHLRMAATVAVAIVVSGCGDNSTDTEMGPSA